MDKGKNRDEKNKDESQESGGKENKSKRQISVWEWIAAFVGFVLVVGAIGFMLYEGFWASELPPDVKIEVEPVKQVGNGYLIKFRATNQGDVTAEGVVIEAELRNGGEKAEMSQTTVDFLPAHSVRKGGFFFQKDPRQFELQVRAVGYQQP